MVKLRLFGDQSYPFRMSFFGNDNNKLGELLENDDGELSFEGDADNCASIFFDKIVKLNSKYINNNIVNKKQKAA